MTRYIAQRVFQALIVLLLVTLITFSILHALPGGAARSALGLDATQAQIDAYNHQMGYDQPLWKQYFGYLIQIFHGEFGHSFRLNMPVADAIGQRLPKTIVLSLMSAVVAILLAIPIGAIQAVKRNRTADYTLTVIAMLAYSTPLFFLCSSWASFSSSSSHRCGRSSHQKRHKGSASEKFLAKGDRSCCPPRRSPSSRWPCTRATCVPR